MKEIEAQYQHYLLLVNLSEKDMNEVQKKETKQAFFAGFAAMMKMLRDDVIEVFDSLNELSDEVSCFFESVIKKTDIIEDESIN